MNPITLNQIYYNYLLLIRCSLSSKERNQILTVQSNYNEYYWTTKSPFKHYHKPQLVNCEPLSPASIDKARESASWIKSKSRTSRRVKFKLFFFTLLNDDCSLEPLLLILLLIHSRGLFAFIEQRFDVVTILTHFWTTQWQVSLLVPLLIAKVKNPLFLASREPS